LRWAFSGRWGEKAVGGLLILLGLARQGEAACAEPVTVFTCAEAACVLTAPWTVLGKGVRLDPGYLTNIGGGTTPVRLTASTALSVRVMSFNHLHYTLHLSVEETVVESYVQLEALWKQVFGLRGLVGGTRALSRDGSVMGRIVQWRRDLQAADGDVERFLLGADYSWPKKLAFSCADLAELAEYDVTVAHWLKRLAQDQTDALDAVVEAANGGTLAPDELRLYEESRELHAAVGARLRAFAEGSRLAREGQVIALPRKKAGRFVTATFTPRARNGGAEARSGSVEYFVHSTLPLSFHTGLSYGGLDDVEFDTVRSTAGADLYAQVKKQDSTSTLVTFLSYRLLAARPRAVGFYLTLGTDLAKPGDRLYAGGTVSFGRVFVTGGGMSGTVDEARGRLDELLESAAGRLESRELYHTVVRRRDWAGFVSVSFDPFR
jgi:hypothetical protein